MPKALKTLLDMSRKARMERAREMGFDTERVLYHGTADDINAFDLARADDAEGRSMALGLGRGKVYLTEEPAAAASFAARRAEQRSGARPRFDWREHDPGDIAGANVLPVRTRGRFMPDEEYRKRFRDLTRGVELSDSSVDTAARDEAIAALDRQLVEEGYAGVEDGVTGQVAVFDPSNIRSVNAAFDPAQRDSSNLLAGVGAAAVGAGLLAPQEADAGLLSKIAHPTLRRKLSAYGIELNDKGAAIDVELGEAADPQHLRAIIEEEAATLGPGASELEAMQAVQLLDEAREAGLDVDPDGVLRAQAAARYQGSLEESGDLLEFDPADPALRPKPSRAERDRLWREIGDLGERISILRRKADSDPYAAQELKKLRDYQMRLEARALGRSAGFARPGAMAAAGAGGALASFLDMRNAKAGDSPFKRFLASGQRGVEEAIGFAENLGTFGMNMLAEPIAGYAGLVRGPDAIDAVRNAVMPQSMSPAAMDQMQGLGEGLESVGSGVMSGLDAVGQPLGIQRLSDYARYLPGYWNDRAVPALQQQFGDETGAAIGAGLRALPEAL